MASQPVGTLDTPAGDRAEGQRPGLQVTVTGTRDVEVRPGQDLMAVVQQRRRQRPLVRVDRDDVAGRHSELLIHEAALR